MKTLEFVSKDQNWMDGTTVYWFSFGSYSFGNEDITYGILDDGCTLTAVYADGSPIRDDDSLSDRVFNAYDTTIVI